MSFLTLSAILRGPWLIDKSFVQAHLPIIHGILSGKSNGSEFLKGDGVTERPFVYANGQRIPAYRYEYSKPDSAYIEKLNDDLFPDNSIFVIPSIGPVTKYNGDCGEPGNVKRQGWASDFASNDKLIGLISFLDTPGGQADGTPQFADYVKGIDKPKKALVDGGAYSAGAWHASAHDEIILANNYAGFGSIGAYTTFVDYTGYFKKMGFKVEAIYPEQSSEKNIEYREAQKGNMELMRADIGELASSFIAAFAENRTGKLKNNSWEKGKAFSGADALSIGLVDGVGSFEDVAKSMGAQTKTPGKKIISIPTNNNSNNMKFGNLSSLSNVAKPTDEQIDLANADLTTENITALTLVRESFIQESADISANLAIANTALATANARIVSLTSELGTANGTIATNATAITGLQAQVAAFGRNAGATHVEGADGNDAPAEDTLTTEQILNGLAHNQTADKVIGKTPAAAAQ